MHTSVFPFLAHYPTLQSVKVLTVGPLAVAGTIYSTYTGWGPQYQLVVREPDPNLCTIPTFSDHSCYYHRLNIPDNGL